MLANSVLHAHADLCLYIFISMLQTHSDLECLPLAIDVIIWGWSAYFILCFKVLLFDYGLRKEGPTRSIPQATFYAETFECTTPP